MDFAHPKILYLLAVLPLILALYLLARYSRKRKLARYGRPELLEGLMPEASKYKPAIKIVLMLLAVASLIIALARPRHGEKEVSEERSGIEIMIAVDVSRSMLASSTDDAKGISRLDRAKFLFTKLINGLGNDKVGLVVFAGRSSMQLPITSDFVSAKLYINDLSTDMIKEQGTDIGAAIDMCLQGFSANEDVNRAIILLTDAEDHEAQAIAVADKARQAGVQVNVIGVGTAKGALIPIGDGGNEFLKDESGTPVTTRFNSESARQIAESGSGNYINGNDADADAQMIKLLDKIDKADLGAVKYKASAERFYVFLWIAFALIVIDIFVLERKIGWLSKINFFSKPVK
ncbi:MAG: VWA domain-containing protein [Bacteroidales bacterium]|nr:VWA domain-containing protein [Bacteroidales bacterium]